MKAHIALDNVGMVTSSKVISSRLQEAFGDLVGPLLESAVNLGHDHTAGTARRVRGRNSKTKARLLTATRRTRRLARQRGVVGRRATKVFCAGALPALQYGADVHGMSDAELLRVRRLAASTMKPSCGGRSLCILTRVEGDPAWYGSVAPLLHYHRELWLLRTRMTDYTLSWAQIRFGWESVWNNPPRTWRSVKGPLGAMYLSISRLGWTMSSPYTLTDDRGVEIPLLLISPALLKRLCKSAIFKALECEAGDKYGQGSRLCFDVLCTSLNSKKYTPKQKGIIRTLTCQGFWPLSRAKALGYQVEDKCPLCQAEGDTMIHRLWFCPACEAERSEHIKPQLLSRVRQELEAGVNPGFK
eukprot:8138993-Pyramimonas_sp.AAC.1